MSNDIDKLIAKNFSDFFIDVSEIINSEVYRGDDYNYVIGKDYFWPTGIFNFNIDEDIDRKVHDIIEKMKLGVLPRVIMTDPFTRPSDYHNLFEKCGLTKKSEAIGMAIKLSDIPNDVKAIDNLEVILINGDEYLLEWSRIVCMWLFGMKESDVGKLYEIVNRIYSIERFRLFLALIEGKPVATSLLYLSEETAGVYHIATIPEYRNKGIGKQITLASLQYAKNKGYDISTLQASPLGEVIYKQLGFNEYCRLGRYRLY